jgi:hypothetical protein
VTKFTIADSGLTVRPESGEVLGQCDGGDDDRLRSGRRWLAVHGPDLVEVGQLEHNAATVATACGRLGA